jgi:uncharacterized spore protein YtfJ
LRKEEDVMTTQTIETQTATVLDHIRGTSDALSVSRVFGTPYECDGVTVIPVARVTGSAAGGGGEGTDGKESGGGFGTGFGVGVHGIGVYEVRNGTATWRPALDVNYIIRGTQVLAGIVAVCTTLALLRRKR